MHFGYQYCFSRNVARHSKGPYRYGNVSSQINLSWIDHATAETGFKIERKTGSGGTYAEIATVGANVTNYSDTGLNAGTTYFYRVRAYNSTSNSSYSNEASATTQSNPPGAPTNLGANAISSSQINLIGLTMQNETGFKIERKTGAGGTYGQIATVGANVTTYSDSGLTANTNYFYRVRANNSTAIRLTLMKRMPRRRTLRQLHRVTLLQTRYRPRRSILRGAITHRTKPDSRSNARLVVVALTPRSERSAPT